MTVQIDTRTERTGTLGGQLKTPPTGAGNTGRRLTTTPTVRELSAMADLIVTDSSKLRTIPIPADVAAKMAGLIRRTSRVNESGCHVRERRVNPATGYSTVATKVDGRVRDFYAHRIMWTHVRGAIPSGMTIDHLCGTRNCVNVDHMEVVTLRENILRSEGAGALNLRKTHCQNGHELPAADAGNARVCRECARPQPTTLGADDSRHGTPTGYKNHGCRCAQCKAAHALYNRELKARRAPALSEAHRRNQLALSILSHRDPTPDTIAAAIAALRGESLPSLVLRGA